MSNNCHRCVINRDGYYVAHVLLVEKPDGNTVTYIYILKPGETLVEALPPFNIITPRWTGIEWEETASPEEIEATKPELEPQIQHQPSESDRLRALEEAMLDLLMGGNSNV